MAGDWTYVSTDLLSGQVLADSLPLTVQSMSANINGTGTLTASLTLDQNPAVNAPFIAALAPRRAVLWAVKDGWPVWCGIVLDWPQSSVQQGTLSISAQTLDVIWGHRLITDTLEYPAVDLFTVFTDLVTYGMTKQSSYISDTGVASSAVRPAAYLQIFGTQGGVARLQVPDPGTSGVPWTASYTYSDLTQVSSAWSDMAQSGNLEYYFEPGLDEDGDLAVFLRLGYLQLGRPLASSGIVFSMPGNVLDYGWQVTGSQSSNYTIGTAPPNGSAAQWASVWPHGADEADLATYPVFESTASWQGSVVTSQSQINSWADGQVALQTAGVTIPTVTVGGGSSPRIQDMRMGDSAMLALTSPMHPPRPDGSPGVQQQVRITGWTITPPGPSQAESVQVATSAVAVPV